jgi:hypothetical protein
VEGDVVGGVAAGGLGLVDPVGWSPVRHSVDHVTGRAAFAVLAVVMESAHHQGEVAYTQVIGPNQGGPAAC